MPYLIGGLFVVGGALVVYGAITGRLAAMLGGLIGVGSPGSGTSTSGSNSPYNPQKIITNPAQGGAQIGESWAQWIKKHLGL